MKKLLFLLPVIALLAGCGVEPLPEVDTSSAEYLLSRYVEPVVLPTTGSVTVEFEKQPTKLAGNYQDNGTMLRAWSENNIKTLSIPAEAKDVTISFKLAKPSVYNNIPGNIQAWVGETKLCNGRLSRVWAAYDNYDSDGTLTYKIDKVSTQDKLNNGDRSIAVGNTLTIKAWIGESNNYLESITVNRNL